MRRKQFCPGQSCFGLPQLFGGIYYFVIKQNSQLHQILQQLVQIENILTPKLYFHNIDSKNHIIFLYNEFCFQGSKSQELAAASRLDDNVNFYQTKDVGKPVADYFSITGYALQVMLGLIMHLSFSCIFGCYLYKKDFSFCMMKCI